MPWKQDPTWNEPKPQRYFRIHCFDCKRDVGSKSAAAQKHRGHEVMYLDKDGKRMD